MKYESDILEMIHENAIAEFKIGILSEEDMRKYDKLCLPEEALQDNTARAIMPMKPKTLNTPIL